MIILCDKKVVSRDCPSGPVVKTVLPLQGALVGELRSRMLPVVAKKKKKKKGQAVTFSLIGSIFSFLLTYKIMMQLKLSAVQKLSDLEFG